MAAFVLTARSLPGACQCASSCSTSSRTARFATAFPRLPSASSSAARGAQQQQQQQQRTRRLQRDVGACSTNDDAAGPSAQPVHVSDELPPELRDLAISDDGFLIDQKTGKAINEFGATRFDVAVRALRGELDPPEWVENTERSPGVILGSLFQFPRNYIFQVVGRVPREQHGAFVADVTAVIARCCQVELEEGAVSATERLGGKYVSVAVECSVRAPEVVTATYEQLGKDTRVIMKF